MIRVSTTVDIERPATEVFDFVADASNNPRWQRGMRSCRWREDGGIEVGAHYDQVASMLGREIRSTFEVVALEPGRSITIATVDSTFPIRVTRMVADLGPTSCRASAVVEGEPGGVFAIAKPVMRWMVGRSVRRDWRNLRQLLEAGAAGPDTDGSA